MSNRKAFTLIELLVVISIVALLASVVLAALNSAREKGRLSGGKQFESNVYHAEADQAASILDFNDCSGTTAADSSGNGNNGVLTNMIPTWSTTDTPSGTGCSLSFDGTDDWVNEGNASSLNITGPLTVSAWVKLNDLSTRTIMSKWGAVASNNYSWLLFANFGGSGRLVFLVSGNGTGYTLTSSPNGLLSTGKWYFLTGVYDGTSVKVFIDGLLTSTNTTSIPSPLNVSATPVSVGSDFDGPGGAMIRPWNGLIDDPRIFSKALTASEVGRLYAEGLHSHKMALK